MAGFAAGDRASRDSVDSCRPIGGALVLMVLIPWLAPPGAGLWHESLRIYFRWRRCKSGSRSCCAARCVPCWSGIAASDTNHAVLAGPGTAGGAILPFRQAEGTDRARKRRGRRGSQAGPADSSAWNNATRNGSTLISRALLVDTQLALAIERWKARHARDLRDWLDAWAEFEALNALACYAHEHPEDVFPEMLEGAPRVRGRRAGPSAPAGERVRSQRCPSRQRSGSFTW